MTGEEDLAILPDVLEVEASGREKGGYRDWGEFVTAFGMDGFAEMEIEGEGWEDGCLGHWVRWI